MMSSVEEVTEVFGPSATTETDWLVLTGIPVDGTGTGRFVRHIVQDLQEKGRQDVRILCSPLGNRFPEAAIAQAVAAPRVLLLHPQFFGRREAIEIMERRAALGKRSHYYVLDSSFFCVASYNHLTNEIQPCLRCLGGHLENGVAAGCATMPVEDGFGLEFTRRLQALGRTGAVSFLVQNHNHGRLARLQFGPRAEILEVGLWCGDWTEVFDAAALAPEAPPPADDAMTVDVVFHGHANAAKGLLWVLEMVRLLPSVSFFLPMSPQILTSEPPPNLMMVALQWETGLSYLMQRAKLVLVPSLWSASIEGALVKSIVAANAVATVRSSTAFSGELPDGLIARLPPSPLEAAREIASLVSRNWRPDPALKASFVATFAAYNKGVVERMLPRAVPDADAPPARPVPEDPPVARGDEASAMRDIALLRPAFPRRFPGRVEVGGRLVRFADLHSFYFQYKQIFQERLYAFDSPDPRPYILDCGAHIGLASLFFASQYPLCTIEAFEADPDLARLAEENLRACGVEGATVHAAAVWSHDQGVVFRGDGDDAGHVAGNGAGQGTGQAVGQAEGQAVGNETGRRLPSVRLRDWLTTGRRVSLLKLDVEGAEYTLLPDCGEALQAVDRLIVETHHLEDGQGRVGDVLGVLAAQGFQTMLVDVQQARWVPGRKPPFGVLETDKELATVLAWRDNAL